MTEPVGYQRTGAVALVTITAPPANALRVDVVAGLAAAFRTAREDAVSAVVITSGVDGFFVAGADLDLAGRGDPDLFAGYLRDARAMIETLPGAPFLSIAAIDGHALGGGLELAAACTLRVAGPRARLGVPEIKLGLLPGAGGTQRLPRLVGRAGAVDLLLTGRSVDGAEALALGLVDRRADDAVGEAEEWAHELAQGPVQAYIETMACVDASDRDPDAGMQRELDGVLRLYETADAREGITAFLEKRRPHFGQGG